MRITVRTLLIYVACVGIALGQARLPLIACCVCLIPEVLIVACFIPLRLSFWLTVGITAGVLLGLVVGGAYFHWTEINPFGVMNLSELKSHFVAETERLQRCFAYGDQIGALLGGTVGLVIGELRFRSKQRTAKVSSLSSSR